MPSWLTTVNIEIRAYLFLTFSSNQIKASDIFGGFFIGKNRILCYNEIMKLEIQTFIDEHPTDWESVLSQKPYCLTISRYTMYGHKLVMLKYSQIDSDFNIPMVRECRGLILDESDGFKVISYAFNKFGNYGESYCPKIDENTMKVTSKIDGSIIKIVKMIDGNLLISTNGTINAFEAPVAEQIGCSFKSFGDIVYHVLSKKFEEYGDKLRNEIKCGYTYIFELVSPWTRVVVPYDKEDLYLIGIRNNLTFDEEFFGEHPLSKFFDVPKTYSFKTFEECLETTKSLPWNEEGYVVMDSKFNRVKVKSIAWLAAHHLVNNHVLSYSRALELVRKNEIDEVLCYFPDLAKSLEQCKQKYEKCISWDDTAWDFFMQEGMPLLTRKEQAFFIMKNFISKACGFALLDNKVKSVKEFYENCPINGLIKTLGYKE